MEGKYRLYTAFQILTSKTTLNTQKTLKKPQILFEIIKRPKKSEKKTKKKKRKKKKKKTTKKNQTKQNIKPSRVFTFTNNVSECSAKFYRQHVVDDRVDGTVDEDHGSTDQPEPGILQLQQIVLEGVVHYDDSVWQPESSEQHHYHDEHAHHLHS